MLYILVKLISKCILRLWGNPLLVEGQANIPITGPMIVVANHSSLIDGFLLVAVWPQRITFLSAAYLFKIPVVGTFLRVFGNIPVQNEGGDLAGIRKALRVLQGGGTLALFPEGHIGTGNGLGPLQKGWAYLALKTGVPVLPVVIRTQEPILPGCNYFTRLRSISVQIGTLWKLEKAQRPRQDLMSTLNLRLASYMEQRLKGTSPE